MSFALPEPFNRPCTTDVEQNVNKTVEQEILRKPNSLFGILWGLVGTGFIINAILKADWLRFLGGVVFLVLALFTIVWGNRRK